MDRMRQLRPEWNTRASISERPLYLFDAKKLKKVKKAYEKPDKYAISSKSKSQVYSVGISGTISTKSEN